MSRVSTVYVYSDDPFKYEQAIEFYQAIGFNLVESKLPFVQKSFVRSWEFAQLEISREAWLVSLSKDRGRIEVDGDAGNEDSPKKAEYTSEALLPDKQDRIDDQATSLKASEGYFFVDSDVNSRSINYTTPTSIVIKLLCSPQEIIHSISTPKEQSNIDTKLTKWSELSNNPQFALYIDACSWEPLQLNLISMNVDFFTIGDHSLQVRDPTGTAIIISKSFFGTQTEEDLKFDERTSKSHSITAPPSPSPSQMLNKLHPSRAIGIMTSGGDSPGMSAFVRAAVRIAIHRGCRAFTIYDGYNGLIQGGPKSIREMHWEDVRGWLSEGGTLIGTARCDEFRERSGRLKAAFNLITAGIDSLVICGGDGSLTGADKFRSEWPSLIAELLETNLITKEQHQKFLHLSIVGVVGSIDNDMSSTDTTIGAYSSLQRICEAVNTIKSTALSHSRAFVIEVMGRHCGWLAVMAAVATSAEFVFTPENPPDPKTWRKKLCNTIEAHRALGKRKTIVIVAEGAIDADLRPITSSEIRDLIATETKIDTRVTLLGHIQRGGSPCAFDRWLATLQGVEAIDAVLQSTPTSSSVMIAINERKITRKNLMEAVRLTKSVAERIERKEFAEAFLLRDPEYIDAFEVYNSVNVMYNAKASNSPIMKKKKVAIIHVGAPAGGMNAATSAAVRYLLNNGHEPLVIMNGFPGLWRHDEECVRPVEWQDTALWPFDGASEIGTNRETPEQDLGLTAYMFQKYGFDALLIIGGFEAYTSLFELCKARQSYPAFRIPMACIPATISNNVPGSDYSVGSDTCLNALMDYIDAIKLSASASRSRVFVCEVQGGRSGYIATYAGLITGAIAVYTPETGINLKKLAEDCETMKRSFEATRGQSRGGKVVLRNEMVSDTYTTDTIAKIFKAEANKQFSVRTAIPGHYQQGTVPSPIDRIRATRMALKSVKFFVDSWALEDVNVPETACVCGIRDNELLMTPVEFLEKEDTIRSQRKPKNLWWQGLHGLCQVLNGPAPVFLNAS